MKRAPLQCYCHVFAYAMGWNFDLLYSEGFDTEITIESIRRKWESCQISYISLITKSFLKQYKRYVKHYTKPLKTTFRLKRLNIINYSCIRLKLLLLFTYAKMIKNYSKPFGSGGAFFNNKALYSQAHLIKRICCI